MKRQKIAGLQISGVFFVGNADRLVNETFISKARWLTIFGAPILFWLDGLEIPPSLLLVSAFFLLYNGLMQFYLLQKSDIPVSPVVLSLIDSVYLTFLYYTTINNNEGMPQLFYFLILVMGIRHGMAKYHWIVLFSGLLYAWTTVARSYFLGNRPDPFDILMQIVFFAAFGIMSSYILKKDYQQQMEKEELFSELQAAYQQLCVYNAQVEELANTDPLTGVYNYRFFTERLEKEIELAKKFNRSLSLIILDIDHFKDFNDTYGHPAGDLALKQASKIFKQNIRDKDVLCRYGGEEFLILLPSTGVEEAFRCAERIREAVQHHTVYIGEDKKPVNITVSGGVACFPVDASNGEQLLRIADEVLYSAKHKGRNKIHRRL